MAPASSPREAPVANVEKSNAERERGREAQDGGSVTLMYVPQVAYANEEASEMNLEKKKVYTPPPLLYNPCFYIAKLFPTLMRAINRPASIDDKWIF